MDQLNLNCYLLLYLVFKLLIVLVYCLFTECIGIVLEFSQLVFESSKEVARFCGESEEFVAINKRVSVAFDTICYVGVCRIKNYLINEGILVAWPEHFSLLTTTRTRDTFEFERTRVSFYGYPVSKWAKTLANSHVNLIASIV